MTTQTTRRGPEAVKGLAVFLIILLVVFFSSPGLSSPPAQGSSPQMGWMKEVEELEARERRDGRISKRPPVPTSANIRKMSCTDASNTVEWVKRCESDRWGENLHYHYRRCVPGRTPEWLALENARKEVCIREKEAAFERPSSKQWDQWTEAEWQEEVAKYSYKCAGGDGPKYCDQWKKGIDNATKKFSLPEATFDIDDELSDLFQSEERALVSGIKAQVPSFDDKKVTEQARLFQENTQRDLIDSSVGALTNVAGSIQAKKAASAAQRRASNNMAIAGSYLAPPAPPPLQMNAINPEKIIFSNGDILVVNDCPAGQFITTDGYRCLPCINGSKDLDCGGSRDYHRISQPENRAANGAKAPTSTEQYAQQRPSRTHSAGPSGGVVNPLSAPSGPGGRVADNRDINNPVRSDGTPCLTVRNLGARQVNANSFSAERCDGAACFDTRYEFQFGNACGQQISVRWRFDSETIFSSSGLPPGESITRGCQKARDSCGGGLEYSSKLSKH